MIWVPLGVLIGGVVLAVVIFGFGAYELNWKRNRLQADLGRLEQLNQRLTRLQADMTDAQSRLTAAQQVMTDRGRS